VAVVAKFRVTRVSPLGDSEKPWATEVELTPDYSSGRNKEWAEATPAGMIRMTVKNELAVEQMPVGTPFTIYFVGEGQSISDARYVGD